MFNIIKNPIEHKDIHKKEKLQITVTSYILIAVCFVLIMSFPTVYARQDGTQGWLFAGGASQWGYEIFRKFFAEDNAIYNFCIGIYYPAVKGVVLPGAVQAYRTAYELFKIIAFLLAMSVALSRMFQKIERGQDTIQVVLMSLVSICVTGIVIINIDVIIATVAELGRRIVIMFIPPTGGEDGEEFARSLLTMFTGTETGGPFWNWKAQVSLALPGIGNYIAYFSIYVLILSKFMEIAVLRLFAPLAVYDIYDEGFRSQGAAYLKTLFACFISLAMSAFLSTMMNFMGGLLNGGISLTDTIHAAIDGNFKEYLRTVMVAPWVPCIMNLVCARMIMKTDDYAKRVVGI